MNHGEGESPDFLSLFLFRCKADKELSALPVNRKTRKQRFDV